MPYPYDFSSLLFDLVDYINLLLNVESALPMLLFCPHSMTCLLTVERGERWGGREKGRNINVREKHGSLASCTRPDEERKPPSRHVLWLGTKPAIFQLGGTTLQQLSQAGWLGLLLFLFVYFKKYILLDYFIKSNSSYPHHLVQLTDVTP